MARSLSLRNTVQECQSPGGKALLERPRIESSAQRPRSPAVVRTNVQSSDVRGRARAFNATVRFVGGPNIETI